MDPERTRSDPEVPLGEGGADPESLGRGGGGGATLTLVSRGAGCGRDGLPHGAALAAEPRHRPLLAGPGGAEARAGEYAVRPAPPPGPARAGHADRLLSRFLTSTSGGGRIGATGWQSGL